MKNPKKFNLAVIIEKDSSGYYIGRIPALRSCYTQAKNLPELYERLEEVASLCLEVEEKNFKSKIPQTTFIGIQNLEFVM